MSAKFEREFDEKLSKLKDKDLFLVDESCEFWDYLQPLLNGQSRMLSKERIRRILGIKKGRAIEPSQEFPR